MGFAKYTHKAFLTGEKDWDEELLKLIPVIRFADKEDVNAILYDWFISLGDDGYDDNHRNPYLLAYTNEIESLSDFLLVDERHLFPLEDMAENLDWLSSLVLIDETNTRRMADLSWINKDYLGGSLFAVLSRFNVIPIIDRSNAPVSFDIIGNSIFSNENTQGNIENDKYRLLGLFRLWNVIEYYYPYRDILDNDWNSLLSEYIPFMLEGTDRLSYRSTLAALTSNLHDAHIGFSNGSSSMIFDAKYGSYTAPVRLTEVEEQLVVASCNDSESDLMPGDVVLRVNGINIDGIVADTLHYVPYPNDDKALIFLTSRYVILRQKSNITSMELDVLRGGFELKVNVNTTAQSFSLFPPYPSESHEHLDNNIGLINPGRLYQGEIHSIMRDFADTNGLIIDLRQYPSDFIPYSLGGYLLDVDQAFVIMSKPTQSIPGMYVDSALYSGPDIFSDYFGNDGLYFYEKSVVLLMDEQTMSQPEFTIMSLRNGPNVTVMGNNSMGADGNVVYLPLPGGITMTYTGLGVYTLEGGQTQRIGLSPDIYVERTIAGIRDGRDELTETAIQYLINSKEP